MKVGDEYDIVVSSGIARCSGPQYNSRNVVLVTVEKIKDGIATMSNGERWYVDTKRPVPNDKAQGEAQGSSRLSPGATG